MVIEDSEFYRSITRPRDSKFYMSIQGLTGMMVSMVRETDPRTNPQATERDKFKWVVEDDIELEDGLIEKNRKWVRPKRKVSDAEAIKYLVDRLSGTELSMKNWKFSRTMKLSELQFTEDQLLKIVGRLGDKGQWRHALSVVKWVYSSKEHKHFKSRFVYTKLLSVLGKARRPNDALLSEISFLSRWCGGGGGCGVGWGWLWQWQMVPVRVASGREKCVEVEIGIIII
ncbi:putative pentatricopeptide repeat-containing protein DG1 [Helianthus annuus]|nr:putative pentatricopeptide repeat-containing protein DG1 [Helianthus annuus]